MFATSELIVLRFRVGTRFVARRHVRRRDIRYARMKGSNSCERLRTNLNYELNNRLFLSSLRLSPAASAAAARHAAPKSIPTDALIVETPTSCYDVQYGKFRLFPMLRKSAYSAFTFVCRFKLDNSGNFFRSRRLSLYLRDVFGLLGTPEGYTCWQTQYEPKPFLLFER